LVLEKQAFSFAAVAATQHKVAVPQLLSTKKTSHEVYGRIDAGRDVLREVRIGPELLPEANPEQGLE